MIPRLPSSSSAPGNNNNINNKVNDNTYIFETFRTYCDSFILRIFVLHDKYSKTPLRGAARHAL
jgi:hypothetical protein